VEEKYMSNDVNNFLAKNVLKGANLYATTK